MIYQMKIGSHCNLSEKHLILASQEKKNKQKKTTDNHKKIGIYSSECSHEKTIVLISFYLFFITFYLLKCHLNFKNCLML